MFMGILCLCITCMPCLVPAVVRDPGTGVTDYCELPYMSTGNQTQVLCKSSKCSFLMADQSLQLPTSQFLKYPKC